MAQAKKRVTEHPRFDQRRFKIHAPRSTNDPRLALLKPQQVLLLTMLSELPKGAVEGSEVSALLRRKAGKLCVSQQDPVRVFQDNRALFERAGFVEVLADAV